MKEAKAISRTIRSGQVKLNIVAEMIRGMAAAEALAQLTFSRRKAAGEVKKALQSAIANAENNLNMNVDNLYVHEAYTGKSITMKRFRAQSKGRGARILKPFSQLTLILREKETA